jgi:glycerate-2-kinase
VSAVRTIADLRRDARRAYDAAVAAVAAGPAVTRALPQIRPYLKSDGRLLIVAAGKAALPMAAACRGLASGFVLSPERVGPEDSSLADFECLVGGHPIPTAAGFAASRRILEAVSQLGRGDTLLLLLSGGASALLEVPVAGLTDGDATAVYDALLRSGLAIDEINLVRGALSQIKTGRLAVAAQPATVVTLAISDVVGDDSSVIGSGPTVACASDPAEAERLLARIELPTALRERALAALSRVTADVTGGHYCIVASAGDAADAARASLIAAGYMAEDAPLNPLLGEADDVARVFADTIRRRSAHMGCWCLVAAGETTVRLPAHAGDGGRNRHLACRLAQLLDGVDGFVSLSAGSDGQDGSVTGAGGIVDGTSAARMRSVGIQIEESLRAFDSGTALARIGDDLVTGRTATNVGDLVIVVGDRGG